MKWPFSKRADRPAWQAGTAEKLIGATVLVGMTCDEPDGERLEQFYGTVMCVDRADGVTLRLEGSREGEIFILPPDLAAFFPAAAGAYRLRQTGEVVVDPDYTTKWTRTAPRH